MCVRPDEQIPALQLLLDAPAWLLWPGTWLLEHLFFQIDSDAEIALAALISVFAYTTSARFIWTFLGRVFGFYHFQHFRFFIWIPWRPFFRRWMAVRDWWRKRKYGDGAQARLATFLEKATMLAKPGAFPLGRLTFFHLPLFQMVSVKPDAHLMVFGGTGSGKTVAVVTALIAHRGSSILVDPSANATNVLHASCGQGGKGILGKGQPSFCLDPDKQVRRPGFETNRWNIYDEWDRAVETTGDPDIVVKLAFTLANALVTKERGETKPFFPDTAKRFTEGLSLFVYKIYKPDDPRRSLVQFRKLLSGGLDEEGRPENISPFKWLLFRMAEMGDAYGGVIADRAKQIQDASKTAGGDVLTTLRTQTAWLDLPPLQRISQGKSDFSFQDFKTGRAHLSICAAITDVQDSYKGWIRLLLMTAFETFEKIVPGKAKDMCLTVVDECPNLEYIKTIDTAPAHMRKFSMCLVLMAQDVGGMKQVYPNVEGMIGNASATIWLATDNEDNVAEIVKKLGQHTILEKVDPGMMSGQQARHLPKDRLLMEPSDIKEFLDLGGVIVTRRRRHLLLDPPPAFYKDLPVWASDKDPDHAETPGRAMLRDLCRSLISGPHAQPKPAAAPARAVEADPPKPRSRPRPQKSSARGGSSISDGMSEEMARSMYGLTNGRYRQADILARDEHVMATAHGNAEFEQKIYQARAVLMQHAEGEEEGQGMSR